jgi:predicted metalloprotease
MKWEDFRQSDNVEDRRGDGGGGGGGFSIPMGGGGGGLGIGTIVVLGIIGYFLGIDPRILIGGAEMLNRGGSSYQAPTPAPSQQRQASRTTAPSDQMGRFVSAVLAQNEDVWSEVLPAQKGIKFTAAPLVLFDGETRSGCGAAQSAMGPFYCPVDKKIYLDTSFFQDMQRRFGGGGDFAYAYVVSHEMGHHIQDQLGVLGKVQQAQQRASGQAQSNALSVRIELMADCLAGVWAANADRKWQILEKGDIEKAVATAQAIGDDKLQQAAGRRIVPDSFTHGSAAQRVQWLQTGLQSGQIDSCNTFAK